MSAWPEWVNPETAKRLMQDGAYVTLQTLIKASADVEVARLASLPPFVRIEPKTDPDEVINNRATIKVLESHLSKQTKRLYYLMDVSDLKDYAELDRAMKKHDECKSHST